MMTQQLSVPRAEAAAGTAGADLAGRARYTLSIDTGGTFTDGFVSDGQRTAQVKVDTTPHDLTVGFQACVEAAAAAVGEPVPNFLSSLDAFHFSSTIATNTIVERRGARVGLIVTAGAEDNLYAETEERAQALTSFVDSEMVRGVAESVDGDGAVAAVPDPAEIEAAVRELLERGVRLLVVSFANAHLNAANEMAARAIIDRSYPRHYLGAVPLMVSSRISLAPTDHGRTAVAVVNAYLHPNLVRALYRAEDQTRERGMRRPLLIVNTDGSSSRVAKTRAIDTYNSGPSAGVLGASYVAERLGAGNVCTFDVGGTTTDVAYLEDAVVPQDDLTQLGPVAAPHPAVGLWSFGIGGGSLIEVGEGGEIRVGPESAGSAPGPACFGLGGESLTPTDVWLLLGFLAPGAFLGGRRQLDPGAAEAVASGFAERLGEPLEAALLRAKAAVGETLGAHLREWAAGHPALAASEPADRWLFSYGGGGGLLCVEAADALAIPRVVVFPHSSVFSAFGGGLLPIAHTYEVVVPAGSSRAHLGGAVSRLADNARRDLRAEGFADLSSVTASVSAGGERRQTIPLSDLIADPLGPAAYETPLPEPLRIRLAVEAPRAARVEMLAAEEAAAEGERQVTTEKGVREVPLVAGLGSGRTDSLPGPAFVQAPDTTIFCPAGWSVEYTEHGYGLLTREEV